MFCLLELAAFYASQDDQNYYCQRKIFNVTVKVNTAYRPRITVGPTWVASAAPSIVTARSASISAVNGSSRIL